MTNSKLCIDKKRKKLNHMMLNVNSKQMKQDDKKGYIKIIKLNIYINDLFFFLVFKAYGI